MNETESWYGGVVGAGPAHGIGPAPGADPATPMSVDQTVAQWRSAAEAGDAAAAVGCLAPDVVLVSPLTDRFRFEGRSQLFELLDDVFAVMRDIRFVDELRAADGRTVMLSATARIADRVDVTELQRLRLGEANTIAEITIAMRPLPALTALLRALGPRVARRQGHPLRAPLLGAAGAMLDSVAASGDRRFLPLAAP
ncbi:nuclear transport factor 2 family protein [Agromyces sp. Soil535]|uniref:nuclear transport factor 2 family protein n=1 Tax=Agromyces sp. Soil535 TaxID=1736390 RepID=UPI000701656F|nr:nuclear transport factor 2 family protein [Agromyces sp. Soil535]KRE21823.1 hypothetical protein ASG80_12080 [Agromyces sp. Soil535]